MKKYKITVVGLGYVGISNATLLSQKNDVIAIDLNEERVSLVNQGKSTVDDRDITDFLSTKIYSLKASLPTNSSYTDSDYVIIATPTNYDDRTNFFNTESVESVIYNVRKQTKSALIVIKSTVPVGFTQKMREKFETQNILFSPEFLREGQALYDNLHPSRIVVGDITDQAKVFADLLKNSALKKNIPISMMGSTEAEAAKLFANTYLAMRVAFFNEIDTYALANDLNSEKIIESISFDPRIGNYYNNPSFGYGGYCLPKDTKQLLANYNDIPQKLIKATVDSNSVRMDFIVEHVLAKNPNAVGIYRLIMKSGSDNIRESSMQAIAKKLTKRGAKVVIYEPYIQEPTFFQSEVIKDLKEFISRSDIILANRHHDDLANCTSKVFTRDLFGKD